MRLRDFIEKGQARRASKDINLSRSLMKTSESDLKFLQRLKIDGELARKIMTNYYDVLRSILEAISAIDGYKIYQHEAFKYFLIEKGESLIGKKFDRFRKLRNGINYYGKDISVEETKENVAEITKLIEMLKEKYLKGIR